MSVRALNLKSVRKSHASDSEAVARQLLSNLLHESTRRTRCVYFQIKIYIQIYSNSGVDLTCRIRGERVSDRQQKSSGWEPPSPEIEGAVEKG